MAGARYLPNPFAEGTAALPDVTTELCWSKVEAILPQLDECVARGGVPQSTGSWTRDGSVYTGFAGVALTFLRVGLHCRDVRGDTVAATAALQKAHAVASACLEAEPRSREVSFFCGTPGYLAILCVSAAALGNAAEAEARARALLEWAPAAQSHRDDELLFGRAGYIYALLFVKKYGGTGLDFDSALQQTAERMVATGEAMAKRRYQDWPLMWHCFDEPYIGAAHGVVGNLKLLLHCYSMLQPRSQQLLTATLQKLLQSRFQSGNLPIVLGDRSDEHVHWCHGAPGLPALALAAERELGDPDGTLRSAAAQAAEVVWRRGAILKGNGLCHGIAGNGYAFLSLFGATGDETFLLRARAFVELLSNAPLQEAMRRAPDRQRSVPGVPDSPCSLMEGDAGVVCFLLDVMAPDRAAFPGWEL